MKIETVIGIKNYTLMVYYRPNDGLYGFSLIDCAGVTYNFDSIFMTAEEAYHKGRNAVQLAFNFDRNQH